MSSYTLYFIEDALKRQAVERQREARRQKLEEARQKAEKARRKALEQLEKAKEDQERQAKDLLRKYQESELKKNVEILKKLKLDEPQVKPAEPKSTKILTKSKTTEPVVVEVDITKIIEQCKSFQVDILKYRPEAGQENEHLLSELVPSISPDRLEKIYDSLRATLGREYTLNLRNEIFRDLLKTYFLENVPSGNSGKAFVDKVESLINSKMITQQAVDQVRDEYFELLDKEFIREEIEKTLEETLKFLSTKGYNIIGPENLAPNKTIYLETGNPNYRIQCQIDKDGKTIFHQVKVASSKEEALAPTSAYQKELDKNASLNWCQIQKDLLEVLKAKGIPIEQRIIRDAGEETLPIMIDKNKKKISETTTLPEPRALKKEG
ncbi:MAG: hypothetical protein LBF22_09145 [Deltaproteobacteria bacterium]|jgi:hypothetical protein|nr:hypothetical protein [Deltaproteobacteria bacterium]